MQFRAHDLLWLDRPGAFQPTGDMPAWLDDAWLAAAPVVVRREAARDGRIPVGVRGLQRNQRCAGYVQAGAVSRYQSPSMLAAGLPGQRERLAAAAALVPCIGALLALGPRLEALELDWGPAGGAGFWLATGLPVLRATSDLDLLVRAPQRLGRTRTDALYALQADAACRVDVQVDTGAGGFAFSEFARGAGRVLLKTAQGPLLVADPWAALEPA